MSFLHGKVDRDGGALADGALDADPATVLANNALADRKPQPAPLRAGREEGVEDAGERRGRDARSVVPDRDLEHVLVRYLARRFQAVGGAAAQRAALGKPLPRRAGRDANLAA